ncbi:hypothetical protein SAMN04488511_11684 [Pedobacter suwonensis]|uniref:Uncharacterized protein n=1 Tax=Pedobacter suwonensis TaxID=332999 RepID=A0A1I0TXL7_9SPHI|nr:hypothetical protein [Pedobacter suwonensis]SFA56689.1 hypothetical protein SAMN04488511_11684 [Pedobacter suwonensis]
MTTLTIEIKDKDAGFVKEFLSKIGAKVKSEPASQITTEISQALKEIKEMQQGQRKPLSLKDI